MKDQLRLDGRTFFLYDLHDCEAREIVVKDAVCMAFDRHPVVSDQVISCNARELVRDAKEARALADYLSTYAAWKESKQ